MWQIQIYWFSRQVIRILQCQRCDWGMVIVFQRGLRGSSRWNVFDCGKKMVSRYSRYLVFYSWRLVFSVCICGRSSRVVLVVIISSMRVIGFYVCGIFQKLNQNCDVWIYFLNGMKLLILLLIQCWCQVSLVVRYVFGFFVMILVIICQVKLVVVVSMLSRMMWMIFLMMSGFL